MRKLSVYIHLPFCVKKCFYCDFLSFPAGDERKTAYMEALFHELKREAVFYREYMVDTVFIGGGTPSVLKGGWIKELLCKLKENFAFVEKPEITIEVNPGSVDAEKLLCYRQAGINRLSIGTQSVHDGELLLLGRAHDASAFYETFRLARETGFDNINVDLISAIPGQTCSSYTDTLETVAGLGPEHISAYSLIVEEGTPFFELYGEGKQKHPEAPALPSEDEERRMYEATELLLGQKGYRRYEISNYARPGMCCRHNKAYWRRYDYVGLGLGASSMVKNVRWKNTEDFDSYVNYLQKEAAAVQIRRTTGGAGCTENGDCRGIRVETQILGRKEQMEEFMFLGLRFTEGVSRKEFFSLFGEKMQEVYGEALGRLYRDGLLEGEEWVRLTPYGRDISNYVMAQFLF